MKLQLLHSSFDGNGSASGRQHLTCFVIDDVVAIDAGSLAMAANETQRRQIRDVVLTHSHLDHIAGLPLFIDDLFSQLEGPVTVHSTTPVIHSLEHDIFNWRVYPKFSELSNDNGPVLTYKTFEAGDRFSIKHLDFRSIDVNHKVPSTGFIVSDPDCTLALSGDTAEMDHFWNVVNETERVDAVLIECAFPNELDNLARVSYHLTPARLKAELEKLKKLPEAIYIVNVKPMYHDRIAAEIASLGLANVAVLEVGKVYEW